MEKKDLEEILALHKKWMGNEPDGLRANLRGADLSDADLHGADLSVANLRCADLRGADLCGANLDYSDWPLWCGSLGVRVCRQIFCRLAYHLCRVICDDPEVVEAQKALRNLANQFHLVEIGECPRVEDGGRLPCKK